MKKSTVVIVIAGIMLVHNGFAQDKISASDLDEMKKTGTVKNLLSRSGFEEKSLDGSFYPATFGKTCGFDENKGCNSKTSLKLENASPGIVIFKRIKVIPAEVYAVEIDSQSARAAALTIRWLTSELKYFESGKIDVTCRIENTLDKWQHTVLTATVPQEIAYMDVMFGPEKQAQGDVCWIDNIGIYKIK